jgi:hypothetical protein
MFSICSLFVVEFGMMLERRDRETSLPGGLEAGVSSRRASGLDENSNSLPL